MAEAEIAFIGGSGLYDIDGLTDPDQVSIDTPFGPPSDAFTIGTLQGRRVAFLARHGKGHRHLPSEIPFRANIYALKLLGAERIISISAVGSLQESIAPLDMVVPDQIIDRTRGRVSTFFGNGVAAHVGFADPFCSELRQDLVETASNTSVTVHDGGVYVVMEGPQFSTRAESQLYRSWGASIIGMTALPEAKLAREAEICYATLALVTDYDVWHQTEAEVSVDLVVANLMKNVETTQALLPDLAACIPESKPCDCQSALERAIITSRDLIPDEAKSRLSAIIGPYL
ncbi:MAG: S-methyl-5'-thioadenosine phosphorylase [Dehalococcoidia bacterium]|nr:S-methyl-5'-thioadenosine phosphorylase [Dehalococcoidia bacterium]